MNHSLHYFENHSLLAATTVPSRTSSIFNAAVTVAAATLSTPRLPGSGLNGTGSRKVPHLKFISEQLGNILALGSDAVVLQYTKQACHDGVNKLIKNIGFKNSITQRFCFGTCRIQTPPLCHHRATKHRAESLRATRESVVFHNLNIPLQEVLHTNCGNPPLKNEEDTHLSVSPTMYTSAATPHTRVLETTHPSHELDRCHKWSSASESHPCL
jgi:hypothetical protein